MAVSGWKDVFPLPTARQAVAAVFDAWTYLAGLRQSEFDHHTHEPRLTTALTAHLRNVSLTEYKLSGFWANENVRGVLAFGSAKVKSSTRTDIEYLSDRDDFRLQLVFEFKRVDGKNGSLEKYAGLDGIRRFVDGQYSHGDSVALMVAVATKQEHADIRQKIKERLEKDGLGGLLAMRGTPGRSPVIDPSMDFAPHAEFDTQHTRPKSMAPEHGFITVGHMLLKFDYEPRMRVRRRKA